MDVKQLKIKKKNKKIFTSAESLLSLTFDVHGDDDDDDLHNVYA